jgi:TFIIF-interacting CTD phosphatase-like protein
LLNVLDPNKEVFKTVLYQNSCYIFEIEEENILELIKDISRFRNRDIARSILMDPRPINFMMTPENAIPMVPYSPDY